MFSWVQTETFPEFSVPGLISIFVTLENSIIHVEKQKLSVRSPESSVKPHSHGNYLEFLENTGQLFCQFSDLSKVKRPQGARPSPRAQSSPNSTSDDF